MTTTLHRSRTLIPCCIGGLLAVLAAASCTSEDESAAGDAGDDDGGGSAEAAPRDGATSTTDGSAPTTSEASAGGDASADGDAVADDGGASDGGANDGGADADADAGVNDAEAGVDAAVDPCAPPSLANLVVNAGLDTNTNAWVSPSPAISSVWTASDALGCATSGSIGVLNLADAGINNGSLQCVPVTAGVTYNFGVAVKIPAAPAGQTFFMISFRGGANCSAPIVSSEQLTANASLKEQWQFLSGSIVAPAGAVTAQVYLHIVQPNEAGFQPLYDRVYLSPAPATF